MRRFFIFSVFWLVLILLVYSTSTKTKGKKSLRSISSDDLELEHKKFKRFDDYLISEIQDAIDHEDYDLFMAYINSYGILVLSSKETSILKYILNNDKIECLEYFLENTNGQGPGDTFNVMIETISMAAPDRQDIIKAIVKPKYIKTVEDEYAILHYLLKMKDKKH